MKKFVYDVGLAPGVFDLFHIGHLNLLKKCKQYCRYLIVAVLTDEYCFKRKGKYPIIQQTERYKIIKAIKYVDKVVYQNRDFQILDIAKTYNVDIVFKGTDKCIDPRWNTFYTSNLEKLGINLKFLKYTDNISTTKIINKIYIKNQNDLT